MTNNLKLNTLYLLIPGLLGLTLPLSIFFSNYLFALSAILIIVQSPLKKKIEWLPMLILAIPALVPIVSVLLHKEAFIWTDFEVRLPFIVVALLVGFFNINNELLDKFKYGLVLGTILAASLVLTETLFLSSGIKSSLFLDIAYPSLFIVISLILFWYTDIELKRTFKIVLSILFLFALVVLGKPFFIIAGFLIGISALIVKGSPLQSKISVAVIVLVSILLLYKGQTIQNFIGQYQKTENLSSAEKLAQWQCVLEIMESNELIGIGFIDKNNLLIDCYHDHGMTKAENLALNAHNEYLDFFLILGYIGILALVVFFMNAFFVAYDFKQVALLLTIILIALFSLTENIFTRQKGVMITTITYLLVYSARGKSIKESEENEDQTVFSNLNK